MIFLLSSQWLKKQPTKSVWDKSSSGPARGINECSWWSAAGTGSGGAGVGTADTEASTPKIPRFPGDFFHSLASPEFLVRVLGYVCISFLTYCFGSVSAIVEKSYPQHELIL